MFSRPSGVARRFMNVDSNGSPVAVSTASASSWNAAFDLNGVVSGRLIGSLSIRAGRKASLLQVLVISHALAV